MRAWPAGSQGPKVLAGGRDGQERHSPRPILTTVDQGLGLVGDIGLEPTTPPCEGETKSCSRHRRAQTLRQLTAKRDTGQPIEASTKTVDEAVERDRTGRSIAPHASVNPLDRGTVTDRRVSDALRGCP
jgi:hypothetical protein